MLAHKPQDHVIGTVLLNVCVVNDPMTRQQPDVPQQGLHLPRSKQKGEHVRTCTGNVWVLMAYLLSYLGATSNDQEDAAVPLTCCTLLLQFHQGVTCKERREE